MKHIKAITAISNPIVNSYKRLIPGYEAPVHIAWSGKNRSPLIRIPAVKGEDTRIELRSPDPSCNPYLTLAVCLAAGLEGIEASVDKNIFDMTEAEKKAEHIEALPATLIEAVKALEEDEFIKEVLGAHVTQKYVENKKLEWEEYISQVTAWETDTYLYRI